MHSDTYFTVFLLLVLMGSALGQVLPIPARDIPDGVDLSAGGRSSVHGWLWMPTMLPTELEPSPYVLRGYWSHHTPEYWTHSPHDFQLLLRAELELQTAQPELPFVQTSELVGNEYTFTPPYDFSLNDLIESRPLHLAGNFYNGSFDTTYERIKLTNAKFVGEVLPQVTTHYLNRSSTNYIKLLPYLSYPRVENTPCADCEYLSKFDVYMAHLIHTMPDFDQVIHGHMNLWNCTTVDGDWESLVLESQTVGATWVAPSRNNTVEERLLSDDSLQMTLISRTGYTLTCPFYVLEEIHCVVGPNFGPRCDSL